MKWMWGAVCGKTARTVLRGVYFNCYFKEEVDLLMMLTEYASKIHMKTIREEGRAEGHAEGRESERIFSIRNVMSNLGVGVDRAMEILGIPAVDFPKYRSLL